MLSLYMALLLSPLCGLCNTSRMCSQKAGKADGQWGVRGVVTEPTSLVNRGISCRSLSHTAREVVTAAFAR